MLWGSSAPVRLTHLIDAHGAVIQVQDLRETGLRGSNGDQ